MLEPSVWPATATTRSDGVLVLGGVPADELVREFGTPAFVLDEADFRARSRIWREAFGDGNAYYAGKAFLCHQVVRWVDEDGLGLDVCTGGELAVAERAAFPPARITFHGNNKSVGELRRAVAYGVGRVVVDSFEEIERLTAVAAEAGVTQPVLVRVTPGVEAHTHEYVQTGQEDQKFGFSVASGAAAKAVEAVASSPSLRLGGLHAHIGSQIFETQGFALAAHRMIVLLASVRSSIEEDVAELNLGGGLGIAYTSEDAPLPVREFAERLRKVVAEEAAAAGIGTPRLTVEPGRAIVGPTTVTLYEVGTVKELPGLRTYVSVDGGMSDNIRTVLYDAHYTARLATRRTEAEPKRVTLCGKHCESGDIVIRDVPLPADLRPGDVVAVPATGAYCRAMASNYNHVPRPPVVAVLQGEARLIVRRETEDDLLSLDVVTPHDRAGRGRGGPEERV